MELLHALFPIKRVIGLVSLSKEKKKKNPHASPGATIGNPIALTHRFTVMNTGEHTDLYTYALKVKWSIDECFHTVPSNIFKSKG